MRRVLTTVLFVLIFLMGLAVLLYPLIGDLYNTRRHTLAINDYFSSVKNLSTYDYTQLLEAAREYNQKLLRKPNRLFMSEEDRVEYLSLLNPTGYGIMGTLEIDLININLPIYHGTNEVVLQSGLGHLEGSSLPVGGVGTHAVITGHRGLPTSTLLTNLDRLILDDTFRLKILGETLTYRVDQIIDVEPHETAALVIDPEADQCTLVTCTPYGINTRRLFVRGHRIANEEEFIMTRTTPSDARMLPGARAALLVIIPATLTIIVILFIRLRRVYGRGKER